MQDLGHASTLRGARDILPAHLPVGTATRSYAVAVLFEIQVRTEGTTQVATVIGDVDLATLPRLCSALDGLDTTRCVVDLRSVDWIDPVCLGALIAMSLRTSRSGGELTVVASGSVRDLLAESGLDRVLQVSADIPSG